MKPLYSQILALAEERCGKHSTETANAFDAYDKGLSARTAARQQVASALSEARQCLEERRREVINRPDSFPPDITNDLAANDEAFAKSRLCLLSEFLILWLGSYFNESPRTDIWYETLQILRRQDSFPNYALTMKLYGDVYKRENRRRRRVANAQSYVLAVVDHSVLLRNDEWRVIMDTRATLDKDTSELTLEARKALNQPTDALNPLLFCAERMARLYAERQVLQYVKQFPIEMIVMPPVSDDDIASWSSYARGKFVRKDQRITFLKRAAASQAAQLRVCVLGTHEGLERDLHQQLGDPPGRSKSSSAVNFLRDHIHTIMATVPAADTVVVSTE